MYKRARYQRLVDELKAIADRGVAERRALTPNEEKAAEKLYSEISDLKPQVDTEDEIHRQMKALGSIGNGSPSDEGSLGAPPLAFTKAQLAELHQAGGQRQTKAVISTTESPMSNQIRYDLTEFPFLRDAARILEHIPVVPTDLPRIHYFKGTTGASAAAAVAEGAAKPESSPVWSETEAVVRKLAHYTRANDEVLADFGNFTEFIGREMLNGLIATENEQLLNGGVAPNITGLLNTAGILTRAKGTDSNLDALFYATNDLRIGSSFTEPDIVVLHPTDFGKIRTVKDANGNYVLADPMSPPPFSVWGAKVVVTNRISVGSALVGNLKEAARVYLREAPKLEIAPMGGGTAEFVQNQTLIRAEERLALAVVRPTALVKVTGLV